MEPADRPLADCKYRHDGWTAERRRLLLECLAAGWDVRRSCGRVGLSREGAYRLRRRDPAFGQAWDEALRSARRADEDAFLASLPERLLRTLSRMSGECELRGAGGAAHDSVRVVARV